MAFKLAGANHFAIGVGLRALVIGALVFLIVHLLSHTQLYATTLVIAGIAGLVVADLARVVNRFDRRVERFLDSLGSDVVDLPIQERAAHRWLAPFARTVNRVDAARAKTQQQLQQVQALLDTVSSALFVMHHDGRMSFTNRAAHQLTGSSATRLEDIIAIGPSAAHAIKSLAPGARAIVKLANGQTVLASVAQFSTPRQKIERLLSLQRIVGELDVVEQKAWEDMTRVLAHEMMNSLTPIASLSESLEGLLRDSMAPSDAEAQDPSGEIVAALEAIRRRSHGLMNFVERYREVAELPAPKLQLINVDRFLTNIEQLMCTALRDNGVGYGRSLESSTLTLHADPDLLEQAIINLLKNALHAVSTTLQPRIEMSCACRGDYALISISDNGKGLPENIDQIFVPFFTTRPGGSGIGLNVARHVALAHGGTLTAKANNPQGAVFELALPVNAVEQ